MDLISIIVPVYNVEKYLSICLDSIIAQTYTNLELILVDDGSKDESGRICDEYAAIDKRIKVIHKENEGVSVARNIGIENANGKWIVFVDSDDYVGKEYISTLRKQAFDSNVLVMQGLSICNNGIIELYDFGNNVFNYDTMALAFKEYQIFRKGYPVSKMYCRNKLIEHKIRFNPNISYAEDMIFMLNYIMHIDRIICISGSNYFYRKDSSTLSKRYGSFKSEYLMLLELIKVDKAISKYFNFPITKESLHNESLQVVRCILSIYKGQILDFSGRIKILSNLKFNYSRLVCEYYNPRAFMLCMLKYFFLKSIYLLDLFCVISFRR